jgi:hypothetical protein
MGGENKRTTGAAEEVVDVVESILYTRSFLPLLAPRRPLVRTGGVKVA